MVKIKNSRAEPYKIKCGIYVTTVEKIHKNCGLIGYWLICSLEE